MKQKVSLLAVCAVLLSLFGAGCLAVVLDPGRKADEQLAAARKEDVFALSPADARSVLEQFAPELRFVERQTGVSIDELIYGENAEALSIRHLAAEQKCAVADLLQGLTLYNNSNDKDGFARARLLLQVIKAKGL